MQQTETPIQTTETESPSSAAFSQKVALSIVVPVMNEEKSVHPLFEKLSAQIEKLGLRYEVIFVDDGSNDNTFNELKRLYDEHMDIVRVIRFRRNFSKT